MRQPTSAREALLVEALGEAAALMRQVEALVPMLEASRQALTEAQGRLADQLAAFDVHVTGLAEKMKSQAVKHVLMRTDEAARRSIELHQRAMAVAARSAFREEFGATLQRLQSALQPSIERPDRRWERWLTHVAAAATASAVTWTVAVLMWTR